MTLKKMTKPELYKLAQKYGIKNRSKMTKAELVKALTKYEKSVAPKVAPQDAPTSPTVTSHMPEKAAEPEAAPQLSYPIPDKYQTDTVALLPVNPKKEYAYWEISDKTVDAYCSSLGINNPIFILKVFQYDGDETQELASVRVERYGNWYFDLYCPEMNLWAQIGILDDKGNYHTIVSSKKIKMPSDAVSKEMDKETWMTVGENIEKIYELSGVSDVQKEELLSSARLHSELFKKLHDSPSSFNLHTQEGGEK
jgi:hypothetical protein